MSWEDTRREFKDFAATFDLIVRKTRAKSPLYPLCLKVLQEHKPRSVLDCACGQGGPALAIKKQRISVTGTDISKELIKLARKNARSEGLSIPFKVAGWHELPSKLNRKFDFVMCHGNAIGHCRGERMMLGALRGMRAVTKPGGYLYVDTVSWEYFRTRQPKYRPGPTAKDSDGQHTIIYRTSVPRNWSEPHISEPIHIVKKGSDVSVRHFTVTFYAFRRAELLDRLGRSGYSDFEVENVGEAGYSVVARAV